MNTPDETLEGELIVSHYIIKGGNGEEMIETEFELYGYAIEFKMKNGSSVRHWGKRAYNPNEIDQAVKHIAKSLSDHLSDLIEEIITIPLYRKK